MKKFLFSFLAFLSSVIFYSQITIGGGTASNLMPVSTQYNYTYSQQIMPKPGINAAAAGNITGLTFYLPSGVTLANSNNWTIYLGHTSVTSFTSVTSWLASSSLTEVYSGTVNSSNGEVTVMFTTPFAYNNIDNLVIAVDENSTGNEISNLFYNYSGGSNTVIYYRSNTVNPNPASPPAGTRGSTKSVVTLHGLTVASAPGCPGVTAPTAGQNDVSINPTFTWGLSQNAAGYRISIGTTSGGADVVNNLDLGNINSYTLSTSLNNNTQYYYTVSAYNTAGSSANCTERTFTTISNSAATLEAEKQRVNIYPNPFRDIINIEDLNKVKLIEMYDVSGKMVRSFPNPVHELQVGDLVPGNYLLNIKFKDGAQRSLKVIKR